MAFTLKPAEHISFITSPAISFMMMCGFIRQSVQLSPAKTAERHSSKKSCTYIINTWWSINRRCYIHANVAVIINNQLSHIHFFGRCLCGSDWGQLWLHCIQKVASSGSDAHQLERTVARRSGQSARLIRLRHRDDPPHSQLRLLGQHHQLCKLTQIILTNYKQESLLPSFHKRSGCCICAFFYR